jgi:hypothetical protein
VFLESVGYDNTSLGAPALDTTPNLARLAAAGLSAANHTTVPVVDGRLRLTLKADQAVSIFPAPTGR